MLQERELVPLMEKLLRLRLHACCSRPAASDHWSRVPEGVIKIVDVKCPDSGEADTFHMEQSRCADTAR